MSQIDSVKLYSALKTSLFPHGYTPQNVTGINALLTSWDQHMADQPLDDLSYGLATVYHETGRAMFPVEEVGRGEHHPYGIADAHTHQAYYGRGDVQLTWKDNYLKFAKLLGIDLVNHPELELDAVVAGSTMWIGMRNGMFTGKKFGDYISKSHADFLNARRIINGTDKAAMISAYARSFHNAIWRSIAPVATS